MTEIEPILAALGAGTDPDVLAAALRLLKKVDPDGARAGKDTVPAVNSTA